MPRRRNPKAPALRPLTAGCDVWAYLRVSTTGQRDAGLPVDGQRSAIVAYCESHAYRLTRTYSDEGISGTTDERAQFQAMVDEAQQLRPAAILFWSWSRFSRDQLDAQFYKALLRRHGVDVRSISDDVPVVDGFEQVIEAMMHWQAEEENRQRAKATKRGHHAAAALGYLPAGPMYVPVGYRATRVLTAVINDREVYRRRIELDPDKAPLVRRAYDMRLAGATYEQIHEALHVHESPVTFQRMFRNPAYVGIYSWGETEIRVPAIVTAAEWQAVYDGLNHGAGGSHRRRTNGYYLLTGVLRCGVCGQPMRGYAQGANRRHGPYEYYRCPTLGCRRPRRAPLEAQVAAWLLDELLTPEELARTQARLLERRSSDGHGEEAAALARELARLDKAIANIVAAIESVPDAAELTARLKECQEERRHVQRRIESLAVEAESLPTSEDVAALREEFERGLAEDRRLARAVVRRCLEEVVAGPGDELAIRGRIPGGVRGGQ